MLPVMRYKNDKASKFFVFWYTWRLSRSHVTGFGGVVTRTCVVTLLGDMLRDMQKQRVEPNKRTTPVPPKAAGHLDDLLVALPERFQAKAVPASVPVLQWPRDRHRMAHRPPGLPQLRSSSSWAAVMASRSRHLGKAQEQKSCFSCPNLCSGFCLNLPSPLQLRISGGGSQQRMPTTEHFSCGKRSPRPLQCGHTCPKHMRWIARQSR